MYTDGSDRSPLQPNRAEYFPFPYARESQLLLSGRSWRKQYTLGAYFTAFADRHILGSEDAEVLGILDGTTEVSELVRYERNR